MARLIAKHRNEHNNGGSNLPHETMIGQSREDNHFMAALGEISVARMLNLYWTGCGFGAVDGRLAAADVGGFVEVRNVNKRNNRLAVRPRDAAHIHLPFVKVFLNEDGVCEIFGWAYGFDVKQLGSVFQAATDKPFYVLDDDLLEDMVYLSNDLRRLKEAA